MLRDQIFYRKMIQAVKTNQIAAFFDEVGEIDIDFSDPNPMPSLKNTRTTKVDEWLMNTLSADPELLQLAWNTTFADPYEMNRLYEKFLERADWPKSKQEVASWKQGFLGDAMQLVHLDDDVLFTKIQATRSLLLYLHKAPEPPIREWFAPREERVLFMTTYEDRSLPTPWLQIAIQPEPRIIQNQRFLSIDFSDTVSSIHNGAKVSLAPSTRLRLVTVGWHTFAFPPQTSFQITRLVKPFILSSPEKTQSIFPNIRGKKYDEIQHIYLQELPR